MMTDALAFLGVSALVICTPGPDTALTIRNSNIGGRRAGLLTAAGIAAGQLVWTIAAGVGIAGLLQASQPAFTALKIIGAAYLVFLGIQSIVAALGKRPSRKEAPQDPFSLGRGTQCAKDSSATSRIPRWPRSSLACFHSLLPAPPEAWPHLRLACCFCLMTPRLALDLCHGLTIEPGISSGDPECVHTLEAITGLFSSHWACAWLRKREALGYDTRQRVFHIVNLFSQRHIVTR
jgi:arginine exporter protein ArgO